MPVRSAATAIGWFLATARVLLTVVAVIMIGLTLVAWVDPDTVRGFIDGVSARRNAVVPAGAGRLFAVAQTGVTVMLLCLIVVVTQLRRLVTTVAAADPFDAANVRRLRLVGVALIGMQLAAAVPALMIPDAAARSLGLTMSGPDAGSIVAVIVVFILAEVFAEGTRLRDDAVLTV